MKSKKILIIVLVVILLVLLGVTGVAFAYLKTDFLKTDEQLFYKYLGKSVTQISKLGEEKILSDYFDKLETSPYENNGKLSVKVEVPDEENSNIIEKVNNTNITFSGKTDKKNKASEQKIQLNYTDDVSFPIDYKRVGNMYGLSSDLVVKKYISVDTDRLDTLLAKFNMSEEEIDEILSIIDNTSMLNKQKFEAEIKKYEEIFLKNINKDNFSKLDNSFILTLNEEQTLTILKEILNVLSMNETLPEETLQGIDSLLESLENIEPTQEELLKIIVNKEGTINITISSEEELIITIAPTTSGLNIKFDIEEGNITINISKVKNENSIEYNASIQLNPKEESQSVEIDFDAKFNNLETQNPQENYVLAFIMDSDEESQSLAYEYTLQMNKTFVSSVNIEDLDENTSVILNDQDESTLQALALAIGVQIGAVNNQQMNQLGLTENPLIYATPVGYVLINMKAMVGKAENTEVELFNSTFATYQGRQPGRNIKTLISYVIENNESNPNRIVNINGGKTRESLTSLISQVDDNQNYYVQYSINQETGLVDSITITY